MSRCHLVTTWEGFCASCNAEQPLMLVEHGPRGLRAWLSGAGPEDRSLSYACALCGRVEHVPPTEAEDAEYDATLLRWPDWVEALLTEAPVVRRPLVHVLTLPVQRVSATDDRLLALAAA